MENAADALQMAAFVLIFVLALSISINAFGEARQTSQVLLDYRDREYDYTYIEANNPDETKRIVGAETIIPSIYKAYKENYKIVFNNIGDDGLYKKRPPSGIGNYQPVYHIDLENNDILVLGTDKQKEDFIEYLLYGTKSSVNTTNFIKAGLKFKDNRNL